MLAATAVQHLFAALDDRRQQGVVRRPVRLVIRESTGRSPAAEPARDPGGRSEDHLGHRTCH
ncbi:hypothetical protein ABT336_02310 [Micromonospora sp. NPDC000207]|uniref:hypothetical protein n=1 Tax=Micromonospora sp. NPDC000207 TaxID=3154246 RepID=UPI0033335760